MNLGISRAKRSLTISFYERIPVNVSARKLKLPYTHPDSEIILPNAKLRIQGSQQSSRENSFLRLETVQYSSMKLFILRKPEVERTRAA